MERNPKIGLKKYFPRIHFFKMTHSNFNAVFEAVALNSSEKKKHHQSGLNIYMRATNAFPCDFVI